MTKDADPIRSIEESLSEALETAEDEETRYHIREALQCCVGHDDGDSVAG